MFKWLILQKMNEFLFYQNELSQVPRAYLSLTSSKNLAASRSALWQH